MPNHLLDPPAGSSFLQALTQRLGLQRSAPRRLPPETVLNSAGFTLWSTFDEIERRGALLDELWRAQEGFQSALAAQPGTIEIHGVCGACGQDSCFSADHDEGVQPNWRETLACAQCGLINRWRASVHLFRLLSGQLPEGPIYLTEQVTPVFQWLEKHHPRVIGSEFVDPALSSGTVTDWCGHSVRHEDITACSFRNQSLSAVLSFDVLEHVPDYQTALREFHRILRPGGLLLISVPFQFRTHATLTRAELLADGSIRHLHPPIYHGDPVNADGVLCYHDFGWDLVDQLRSLGFADVTLATCWGPHYGYLSFAQCFIFAFRPH